MDIDEWDLLAVDGLLDFHEDGHGGEIYSRRRSVLDMDHFRFPSPPADRIVPVVIGVGPEAASGPPAVKGIADLAAGKVKAPSLGGSGSGSEREVTPEGQKRIRRHDSEGAAAAAAAAERESLSSLPRMRGEREAAAAAKDKSDAKCEVGEALWERKRSESEGESNVVNNILKRSFTGIGALC